MNSLGNYYNTKITKFSSIGSVGKLSIENLCEKFDNRHYLYFQISL